EEQPRFQSAADKRAHHNALERKRRDHIKDSFHSLRDSVPSLQGEKGTKTKLTLPPAFPYEHLPFPTVFCHG
uniref:Protein max n=1 Tax=Colobus angolensis palliatus TaxID=336983 RepID=A0A2K5I4E6_COLAP